MTTHEPRRWAPRATLFFIASSLVLLSVAAPASAAPRGSCGGRDWGGPPVARHVFGGWARTSSRTWHDPFDRGYEAGQADGDRAGRRAARAGHPFWIGPYAGAKHRSPRFRAGYQRGYVTAYATAYERATVRAAKRHWQRRDHGQHTHGRRGAHRRR